MSVISSHIIGISTSGHTPTTTSSLITAYLTPNALASNADNGPSTSCTSKSVDILTAFSSLPSDDDLVDFSKPIIQNIHCTGTSTSKRFYAESSTDMTATSSSATVQSQFPIMSLAEDSCSLKIMPGEPMSAAMPSTMMSSHVSTGGSTHLLFNSLISVDHAQQQNPHSLLVEDQRTLQLALELSIVGLNDAATRTVSPSDQAPSINNRNMTNNVNMHPSNYQQQIATHQHVMSSAKQEHLNQKFDLNTLNAMNVAVSAVANANGHIENNLNAPVASSNSSNNSSVAMNKFSVCNPLLTNAIEDRSKKSQNMTECVPVPSSEHVAEIVGRQGCKIKALRAKTNTYIKTPVRGEEPVFVVTGRKEDVSKAKREILSAAEHFSLIRATRKPSVSSNLSATVNSSIDGSNSSANSFGKAPPGPPSIPGQVTIQVRVPYRVVGLVVGPKGATIKHIQHQTQTYIVTPSREKEPIFEVTGLPENVQSARKQIEAHIALRTGNLPLAGGNTNTLVPTSCTNESLAAHNLNVLSQILNDPSIDSDLLVSLYKADTIRSTFDYTNENCELSVNKAGNMQSFEVQETNKENFNIGCIDSAPVKKQPYMPLLHSETPQLQNMDNTAHQTNEFVNCLSNNCNDLKLTNSDQESDLHTGLDHTPQLQQQQPLYPSPQPMLSLSHQLQPSTLASSLPPLQSHAPFIGNVGSYTQTLSFVSNAATVNYKSQNTTAAVSNTSNLRNGTHTGNVNNGMARSCSSASSTASSKSANNSGGSGSSSRPELSNIWKNLGDSLDADEGIGDSPNIWTLPTPLMTLTGSHCSPSTSISPTDSLLAEISVPQVSHHNNVGLNNLINESHEPSSQKKLLQQNPTKNGDTVQALVNNPAIQRRDCFVCNSKEITAVLVPCGHNMFCMECANRICELGDAVCPVCSLNVYHAMRILA